jgi:SAM-dependent methyltransferase
MSPSQANSEPARVRSWIEFWDSDHAIYVNERHKLLHARAVGRDIVRHIPTPHAAVLDYGCGEALYAEHVAAHCRRLVLCEAAEGVRERLARRAAAVANIEVMDPAGVERLPPATFDLVVANSLVQYLTRDQLLTLLASWRAKLRPDGVLVVADVIPPNVSPIADAAALMQFAWKGGFLLAAGAGLVRTALSDYGRIRKQLGFAMYEEADFLHLLEEAGYSAGRAHPNFGHNQLRMAFRAVPR